MKQINGMVQFLKNGILSTAKRFPITTFSLSVITGLVCYLIWLPRTSPLIIEKLIFTLLICALAGVDAQFLSERLKKTEGVRLYAYCGALLFAVLYFILLLLPASKITDKVGIYSLIAAFALVCAMLIFPSAKGRFDFNKGALIHFKSVFTSVLYAGVLSIGISAVIAAINLLLFTVSSNTYAYTMAVIWILFAPIYYLSLLPVFEVETDRAEETQNEPIVPKFLEILISYILIPVIAAYTLVMFAYFAKILLTLKWPIGQLGIMGLIYSAVGLILFVLASLLKNRFSQLYCKIFPKVLVPIVIVQLVSVAIRLKAYGVTESRYYVALFGVFSICAGVFLSIKPVTKNIVIAYLAAFFAIISLVPPIDAFTVSQKSQLIRIETILETEGMLKDGVLTPKQNVSDNAKFETTSILSYLNNRDTLKSIQWLPKNFDLNQDFSKTFGFETRYSRDGIQPQTESYLTLDDTKPIAVSGYDFYISISNYSNDLNLNYSGVPYRLSYENRFITLKNTVGKQLLNEDLTEFFKTLQKKWVNSGKSSLDPEDMTFEHAENGYKIKIVFKDISLHNTEEKNNVTNFQATAFFSVPK